MRYRTLGRLEVFDGTQWTSVNAAKQRAVLGLLLVNANHFVSAGALIHELWGDQVPGSAAKSLQVYVHRLRRALGTAEGAVITRSGGYELSMSPGETDAGTSLGSLPPAGPRWPRGDPRKPSAHWPKPWGCGAGGRSVTYCPRRRCWPSPHGWRSAG